MRSPRWRKVIRDIWNNRTRTLLVVLSIAVGVFAIGAISSSQTILARDLDIRYAATNPPSAIISAEPFDDTLVEAIRDIPEVGEAEARIGLRVRLQLGENAWRDLDLIAVPDYDDRRVDRIEPERGPWPAPDEEMLIERASLALTNADVGDSVVIETPSGKQRAIRIAGLAYHLLRPPAQFTGTASGYITMATLEWLGESREYNSLLFTVAEKNRDSAHIKRVTDLVTQKIEKSGRKVFSTFIPTPGKHPADDAVQPILLVLNVLGYLALVMSGFLVVNTIGGLLAQQTRQIGVMKAIGARTDQITQMYFAMIISFGVLALLVAVPLGAVGAYFFTRYIAGIINFDVIDYGIPLQVLLLQIAIGLLVPVLAALAPILNGARMTVREAIAGHSTGQKTRRPGDRETGSRQQLLRSLSPHLLVSRSFPRPLILSLRNTFRRTGRLALTLIALTVGGAMFIAVFSVRESLLLTLDDAIRYRNFDVAVTFNRTYRAADLEREALRVPGVVAAEGWGRNSIRRIRADETESDSLLLLAPPADTQLINPTLIRGRWLLPEDQNAVVINTSVLDLEPDIDVGDTITLKINDNEREWRVVGITQSVLAGPFVYANHPYYSRIVGESGKAGLLYIRTVQHGAAGQEQTAAAIEASFDQAGLQVRSLTTTAESIQQITSQFDIILVFLFIMAVLIAFVGGLGLTGTMSLNVLERTREIGVMRAVGASNGAMLNIFIVEGVMIGLLSWATSSIVSYPLGLALSTAVGVAFIETPLNYVYSMTGLLAWLGGALLLAVIASFLPARNAARLSVRDVLAYE
jgi:putative ABC transport system permease protein